MQTKSRLVVACATITAMILMSVALLAQQGNVGKINGTVFDSSGAAVAGAEVVVTNQGTTLTQTKTTTSTGNYDVELLPVGKYTVAVTMSGFRKEVKADIPVLAGETFTVDFKLQVGATTQTITVTGAAPVVDATDATQGTTRTEAEISNLPMVLQAIAARGAINLFQGMAGVEYSMQSGGGQAWSILSRSPINGTQPGKTGYEIDGVEASPGEAENGEDFVTPVPEQVTEVRLTDNTDASQGFNGGVTMEMITKSGTNQLHGNVYYVNRNDALESRNWFYPKRPEDKQNEGGWTLGGPVYIPKLYDGRNKTFFFASMDFFRYVTVSGIQGGQIPLQTVPDALFKQGNFTEALGSQIGTDDLGRPIYKGEIYDPTTTRLLADGTIIRDPYTYNGQLNVIPPTSFSKVSQFFQQYISLPNLPGIANNWGGFPHASVVAKDQWSLKIDQLIGPKQRVTFSLERQLNNFLPPGCGASGHCYLQGGAGYLAPELTNQYIDDRGEYRYRLSYVWNAAPNILFSFRSGITRDPNRNQYPIPLTGGTGTAAYAGCDAGLNVHNTLLTCRTPSVGITNNVSWAPGGGGNYHTASQRTPFTADVVWTKRNHIINFGVNYVTAPFSWRVDNSWGGWNFSQTTTGLTNYPTTGVGYASYLIGWSSGFSATTPIDEKNDMSEGALYVQDKWRVTKKMTLSYGLRWELTTPIHELHNRITSFEPNVPNPSAGGIPGAVSYWGTGPGENGQTRVGSYYMKAFAPKIGVAYAITPKTIARASFGISYYAYWQKWASSTGVLTPAYGYQYTCNLPLPTSSLLPQLQWDNGPGCSYPQLPVINPSIQNNQSVSLVDQHDNRPPMIENIGGEIERALPGSIGLRVAYVGTFGHREYGSYPGLNELPLKDLSLGNLLNLPYNSSQAVAAGITSPYSGFSGSVAQALRPYPQYSTIMDLLAQPANSSYNALQINVQRHFGDLTFLGNFTWSQFLTESDDPGYNQSIYMKWQNSNFRNEAKLLAGQNDTGVKGTFPRMVNLNWVWSVPVGHGKRWLGGANKWEDELLGNWRASAFQHYAAAPPLTISTGDSIPGMSPDSNFGGIWPVYNAGVPILAPGVNGCKDVHPGVPGKNLYLNKAAFSDPAPFTFGNTSVLSAPRGCAYINEDFGFDKLFPVREATWIDVGVMFNNVFNRHEFYGLTGNIDNASFGQFGSANFPRTVQMTMKIVF